jgi:glycosyltransferase involved in cell wall biosynthesis
MIHDKVSAKPYPFYIDDADDDSWLIYHFSTGSKVNQFVLDHGKNVILIYHNITPAHYFGPYNPKTAEACKLGRDFLPLLVPKVRLAVGVSKFNAKELAAAGYKDPVVSPLIIDFGAEKRAASKNPFGDEKTNILFVGRLAPNKRIEDLIKVFHFYQRYVNNKSRLILVGSYDLRGSYKPTLTQQVRRLDLSDVVFTGPVSDEELEGYFATADVYLSLSRHEGFCVPLLEAMNHDLPVVVLGVAAVPETLGYAGVQVMEMEPNKIAEIIGIVTEDDAIRGQIIETQRRRLNDFDPQKAAEKFKETLAIAFSR